MSEVTSLGTTIGGIVGVVAIVANVFFCLDSGERFKIRKYAWLSVLALLGFLWAPWVAFGVYQAWRVSVNGVEYLERQPTVIPKEAETIDLNKRSRQ